jgi:RNase H-fold protein (predicted Holliday junction resolvase)
MRSGVRVAIDVGDARIGVAACDPDGLLAVPLETVRRGPGDLDRVADIVSFQNAVEVVVGLPRPCQDTRARRPPRCGSTPPRSGKQSLRSRSDSSTSA